MNCDQHSTHDKVAEFHRIFGAAINAPWTDELIRFRLNLLLDELCELEEALLARDRPHAAQESADLEYVLHGTTISLGLDLDRAVAEVHRANMSKLDDDGRPRYRSDGKVLKPAGWTPPDCSSAVLNGAL
jgi:predicted HAD superfamily Cof-like phosphohydrolase